MLHTVRFALCLLGFATVLAVNAQEAQVATPRGAFVRVVATFPPGDGPFPAVVLAPGAGYHMALPVMEEAAAQLVGRGVAVYRFDWAYFSADPKSGRPSKDLALELEDMLAVLNRARRDPRIASGRLYVGGKSLGSGVAWRLLAADKSLRGALLLTPVCSRVKDGTLVSQADDNYPGLADESRPLLFVAGEQDPLCAAAVLYRFAAGAAGPVRVSVVGGNHGLEVPALSAEAADAVKRRNAKLAGWLAADFVAAFEHADRP